MKKDLCNSKKDTAMSNDKDLSLNEIAERIVDRVLECSYIDKKGLMKTIRPILSIWMRSAIYVPKEQKSLNNELAKLTRDMKAAKKKYASKLKLQNAHGEFYRSELAKAIGESDIEDVDKRCKAHVRDLKKRING